MLRNQIYRYLPISKGSPLPNAFDPDLNWPARIARADKVAMQGVDVFAGHSALGCGHCLSSNLPAEGTFNPRLHSRAFEDIRHFCFLDGQNLANRCHLHTPYVLHHFLGNYRPHYSLDEPSVCFSIRPPLLGAKVEEFSRRNYVRYRSRRALNKVF